MPLAETKPETATPPKIRPWALEKLPPFSPVATRLIQILSKEDVVIDQVSKFISAEPVFAARILQLANSPLFALRREVKTISHAVVLVGLERVKAMTLMRAMADFLAPVAKVEAARLCWRHTVAGAILAEKLARACRMEPDVAYTAALLRDIGRLALLVKHPQEYSNLLAVTEENSFDLLTAERDLFDIDHCQAGCWILERLPLPRDLSDIVARHHEPPDGGAFQMVHLVRIADLMADALGFGVMTRIEPPPFEDILGQLPPEPRQRFDQDPQELRDHVASRIQELG